MFCIAVFLLSQILSVAGYRPANSMMRLFEDSPREAIEEQEANSSEAGTSESQKASKMDLGPYQRVVTIKPGYIGFVLHPASGKVWKVRPGGQEDGKLHCQGR